MIKNNCLVKKLAVSAIVLTLAMSSPAYSKTNAGPNDPINNPQPNANAILNKINLPNPLELAADALGLSFAQLFQGGEQAINNWMRNWRDKLLPGMEDQIKQYSTAHTDRAQNYGAGIDAQNASEDAMAQQIGEYEAVQNTPLTESTCRLASGISGSGGSSSGGGNNSAINEGSANGQGGLASATHISKTVARALGKQATGDALNKKGRPSANGPAGDLGNRFGIYAKYFCDPAMNNGKAGCNVLGPLPNADLSVENFLLKDTIDMSKEEEKQAAYAILRNLVQPTVPTPLSSSAMENSGGQGSMIRRNELQALKNMPIAIVSDIIGRRTAIGDSNTSQTIRVIREQAKVQPDKISDKASFNEIMLALAKERFYDSSYFTKLISYEEADLAQEQLGIDILTSIMLRQIYTMQEQMNGLIAARASIKHNGETLGNITTDLRSVSSTE